MNIGIKTPEELQIMIEGGKISALALRETLKAVKAGVTLAELDKIAERVILQNGGKPSFKTVDDYKYTTCININEGIVHGIPNKRLIKEGDIVSIDLGALFKGLHTDLSYTVEVGSNKEEKFLNVGKQALELAISSCREGNTLGDIGYAIQSTIERNGYSVSKELVGHGIGYELHEDPYVPGYGKRGSGPKLKSGMVFAIEVIYQKGKPALVLDNDGWTIKTADGSLSGLFEQTVAIINGEPVVLTGPDNI